MQLIIFDLIWFLIPLILIIEIFFAIFAQLSGWKELAKKFRFQKNTVGNLTKRLHFRSIRLEKWGIYRGLITIHVYSNGILIKTNLLGRPFHPPLFFKWADIQNAKYWDLGLIKSFTFQVNQKKFT